MYTKTLRECHIKAQSRIVSEIFKLVKFSSQAKTKPSVFFNSEMLNCCLFLDKCDSRLIFIFCIEICQKSITNSKCLFVKLMSPNKVINYFYRFEWKNSIFAKRLYKNYPKIIVLTHYSKVRERHYKNVMIIR